MNVLRIRLVVGIFLGSFFLLPNVRADIEPKIEFKAQAFELKNVRLLDGPFKTAMQLDAKYLLDLEPDRLLCRFHETAGLPPKGKIYGGWESRGVSGHILGHYLSACAMTYASTGDERFRERADYIVDELATCQQKHGNGYVGGIPDAKRIFSEVAAGDIKPANFGLNGGWVPWYTLHKLFAGLIDAHKLCDSEKAKTVVIGLGDWAVSVTKNLTDEQFQTMLRCEHGGMNETLADLFAVTGNRAYLDLAGRFNHRHVIDPLSQEEDRLEGLHANTQVPKLIGAARQYELTGDKSLATAADFFWQIVSQERSFVIGGNSEAEHFRKKNEMWKNLTATTAETCNTYNMLKLTKHLFTWSAQATCADYYERALYNHILASQDPKTGMTIYFCSLKPGHFLTYGTPYDSFWCCTGSGLENHVKYGEAIYFHDAQNIYVNLFIASEVTWKAKGLKLRQQTIFPEESTTRFEISCEKPVRMGLKIRRPDWAKTTPVISIGNVTIETSVDSDGYLTIDRTWNDGDVIKVTLPMSLRVEPMSGNPQKIAVMYGPIVLAGQLGREGFKEGMPYTGNQKAFINIPTPDVPVLITNDRPVDQWLKPVDGKPLEFKTVGIGRPDDVTLIPFYKAHHQRYSVYWDIFTEEDWNRKRAEYEAQQRRIKALEARTIDSVVPEMQPERDHNYRGDKSSSGMHAGRHWRHAYPDGWFSYDLKVAGDKPVDLMITYWGSDWGRKFDVLVDGQKIATQLLNNNKPGEFFDTVHPLPEELTKGKEKITVKFQSTDGMAGGVFGCRTVLRESSSTAAAELMKTLAPFYRRHTDASGLLITSSEKVSEFALAETAYLVRKILACRPDALRELVERKQYVTVMAYNEMQTDLPECRRLSPWYDKRARGLGGRPISCGEENLLDFEGDPYRGENIFIHEFAHGIHGAFARLDEEFNTRLRDLHAKAKETGRFRGYGLGTFGEFWAEGVQSWFECNRNGGLEAIDADGKSVCQINNRAQLKEYLPELAAMIDEQFKQNDWVYVPVRKRLDQPHLQGYDPANFPKFIWPPEVIETYNRIEAERAAKRKEAEQRSHKQS